MRRLRTWTAGIVLSLILANCRSGRIFYQSENLKIEKIAKGVWLHTSYLQIPNYGKFPCNGVVFAASGQAIVLDTPIDDSSSYELIRWIEDDQASSIKAVVINHFHNDCLGGLEAFHQRGIASYAHEATVALAAESGEAKPQIGFQDALVLTVGKEKVVTRFFGPGHTADNVVSYLPSRRVLFGGCLIKAVGAGKGNLADADVASWPETVKLVRKAYLQTEVVVPGHGRHGGVELLDYTIQLFEE